MPSLQKYCKAADKVDECEDCKKRFHAPCANLSKDELEKKMNKALTFAIVQTAKLIVTQTVLGFAQYVIFFFQFFGLR